MKNRATKGFTLIELIFGIAVVSVLLGIGIPSFRDTLRNNRIISRTNELIAGLTLARNSADAGKVVVVCSANAALSACAGSNNWSNGWLVFVDNQTAGTLGSYVGTGPDLDVLLARSSPSDSATVSVTSVASPSVTFEQGGVRGSTAAVFTITKSGCNIIGLNKREVTVSAPGVGKISFKKLACP